MRLCIDYGSDVHSVELDDEACLAFKAGIRIEVIGQGFIHETEGKIQDNWVLNNTPGEIFVWFDNGAELRAHTHWLEDSETSTPRV